MSTRCQVVIKDNYSQIWFYRHSDGYPEGVTPSLTKFVNMVKDMSLRNNAEQCAGWLILLGAVEFQTLHADSFPEKVESKYDFNNVNLLKQRGSDDTYGDMMKWKCGSYELTETGCVHGDISHLYVVDLSIPAAFEVAIPKEDGRLEDVIPTNVIYDPTGELA